jgi:hypothetical protein
MSRAPTKFRRPFGEPEAADFVPTTNLTGISAMQSRNTLALRRTCCKDRGRKLHFMTGVRKPKQRARARDAGKAHDPEWAAGLKRLYDAVLDEPLPDSFKDLLSKLDSAD